MCMIDNAEPWTVFRSETRRAAKVHKCHECSRPIEVGEQHEYATGLIDGTWLTMRTCAHCTEARRWLLVVCNGYLFGGVWEDLLEHWDEGVLYSRHLAFGRLLVLGGVQARRRPKWRDTTPEDVRAIVDRALEDYRSTAA